MNEKQNKIAKLLWDFQALREEHIIKLCNCNINDIDVLIANKMLIRESNGIIRYKGKEINNRIIVAFDVVMEYLERNPEIKKGRYPVIVSMKMRYLKYDIVAIKEEEVEKFYENIDTKSDADKVIIIIETKNYVKREINTSKECLICTYPPLDIVDKLN